VRDNWRHPKGGPLDYVKWTSVPAISFRSIPFSSIVFICANWAQWKMTKRRLTLGRKRQVLSAHSQDEGWRWRWATCLSPETKFVTRSEKCHALAPWPRPLSPGS